MQRSDTAPGWWIRKCSPSSSSLNCCERKQRIVASRFSDVDSLAPEYHPFPLKYPLTVIPGQQTHDTHWASVEVLELSHSDADLVIRVNCVTGVCEALLLASLPAPLADTQLGKNPAQVADHSENTLQANEMLICGPIQYNFFRAPTDNDEGGGDVLAPPLPFIRDVGILSLIAGSITLGLKRSQGIMSYASRWRQIGLDRMESRLVKLEIKPNFSSQKEDEAGSSSSSITLTIEQIHGPALTSSCCSSLFSNLGHYRRRSLKRSSLNSLHATTLSPIRPLFKTLSTFQWYPNGTFRLTPRIRPYNVVVAYRLPPLPRVGLTFCLPDSYRNVTYCGLGPHENYCDRQASAIKAVHVSSVDAMYEPYIVPSEYGGRGDVDWISVTESSGTSATAKKNVPLPKRGLLVQVADTTSPGIHCSVHPFSTKDLTVAKHQTDLGVNISPRPPYSLTTDEAATSAQTLSYIPSSDKYPDKYGTTVHLNVDFRHMGVGGECSWFPCVSQDALITAAPIYSTKTNTQPALPEWGVPLIVSPLLINGDNRWKEKCQEHLLVQ